MSEDDGLPGGDPVMLVAARLEALAAVSCVAAGRIADAAHLLDSSGDPRRLAHAAAEIAGSLLLNLTPAARDAFIDGFRRAVIEQASAT